MVTVKIYKTNLLYIEKNSYFTFYQGFCWRFVQLILQNMLYFKLCKSKFKWKLPVFS